MALNALFATNAICQNPDELMQKGHDNYQKGAIIEALKYYEKAGNQYEASNQNIKLAEAILERLTIKLESPKDTNYSKPLRELKALDKSTDNQLIAILTKMGQGEIYLEQYDEGKALEEFKLALEGYDHNLEQKYPAHKLRIYKDMIRTLKGLHEFDKTHKYYQKGLNIIAENDLKGARTLGLFYWSYGDILEETNKFDTGVVLLKKGLDKLYEEYPGDHIIHTPIYNDIAATYKNLMEIDSALQYYNLGIKALEANDMLETKQGGIFYMNRGIVYKHKTMMNRALHHFQKTRSIYEKVLPPEHPEQIYLYMNLTSIHNNLNHSKKALSFNKTSETLIENQPNPEKYENLMGVVYYIRGSIYKQLDEYNMGIEGFQKAIAIFKKLYGENYTSIASSYILLGEIYQEKGAYKKSNDYFKKSFDILEQKRGSNHSSLTRYAYINFAKNFATLDSLDRAIDSLQKGFENISTGFSNEEFGANPLARSITNKNIGFLATSTKSGLLNNLYDSTGKFTHLKHAYQTCQLADTLIQGKLHSLNTMGDKSYLIKEADDFYPLAIDILQKMLKNTPDKQDQTLYFEQAYHFAENDKASMLNFALSNRKMFSTNQLPDSLTQKAEDFKNQVQNINDKIANAPDSADLVSLKGKRLDLIEKKEALYRQIKVEKPKFYQLLTQKQTTPIDKLQSDLKETNKNLIQYVGDEQLMYALLITPKTMHLEKLPSTDALKPAILKYRDQILQPDHQFDSKLAHNLYQKLFEPFEDKLSSNQVIIVPDGILGYLPFSTLLKEPAKNDQIKSHAYLIRDYAFSYSPSASLWDHELNKNKKTSKPSYIGFAPAIAPKENGTQKQLSNADTIRKFLGKLPNAKKEIENVLKLFDGEAYTGSNASEHQFKKEAPGSTIIHLATHGLLDDDRPAYNRLLFSPNDSTKEDGVLHTYELYEMDLNAELAVLSACNTGFGALKKGEGVMSLSRGFKIAGCKNILMTLWAVDDRASQELIENFYKQLHGGSQKSKALRKAKLNYLESNDTKNANPYYWAGYVLMGNKDNLNLQTSSNKRIWWYIAGIALIVVLAGGIAGYRIQKTRSSS